MKIYAEVKRKSKRELENFTEALLLLLLPNGPKDGSGKKRAELAREIKS